MLLNWSGGEFASMNVASSINIVRVSSIRILLLTAAMYWLRAFRDDCDILIEILDFIGGFLVIIIILVQKDNTT